MGQSTDALGGLIALLIALLSIVPVMGGLSDQVVRYQIDASLDTASHRLTAQQKIIWTNPSSQPQQYLYLHLYWNAFRNSDSTLARELGWSDATQAGHAGWIELEELRLDQRNLLGGTRFIQPDDGNLEDRTLLEVPLGRAVAPGQTLVLEVRFTSKFPALVLRSGFVDSFYFAGQWFPKVAALVADKWNLHQFHASSEFFANFGEFDVTVSVPESFVVGSSGSLIGVIAGTAGRRRHHFRAEDVHDFAWTAAPDFVTLREILSAPGARPFEVILLLQRDHVNHKNRYLRALSEAAARLSAWYGPYPYPTLTVVDVPPRASGANGMEYPRLITAASRWEWPFHSSSFESTLVHEFVHQYWYGMVASNEFEEPFLDEGFTSYSAAKILNQVYEDRPEVTRFGATTWPGIWFVRLPSRLGSWLGPLQEWPAATYVRARLEQPQHGAVAYRAIATVDPIVRFSWAYRDLDSYFANAYSRTEIALHTLERAIGEATMARIMRSYFEDWRFRHPTLQNFIQSAERVAGRSFQNFFQSFFYQPTALDFEVAAAESRPEGPLWRSFVTVRRQGPPLTVDVVLEFSDGSQRLHVWDGRSHQTRIAASSGVPLRYAEVDPKRTYLLDVNYSNNRRYVSPEWRATVKWTAHFLFWTQNVLHFWSGLV